MPAGREGHVLSPDWTTRARLGPDGRRGRNRRRRRARCAGLRACGLRCGRLPPGVPPLAAGGRFSRKWPGEAPRKPATPQPRISFTPLTPLTIYPPADHHRWSTGLITSLLCFLSGRWLCRHLHPLSLPTWCHVSRGLTPKVWVHSIGSEWYELGWTLPISFT